jgi:hypothetical protein
LHAHETVAEREESQGSKVAGVDGGGRKFVRGKLLDDEDVVGLVFVEAANDVIAIRPGKGVVGIFAVAANLAFRVAVAGGVEPVAPPAFAVVRRVE